MWYTGIMDTYSWYATLIKPTWAPPSWLFGPVWSVLYAIIAVSFGYVFYKIYSGEIPTIVAIPFAINIVANLIFTPLQFGLQSNALAAVDIVVVLGSLIAALIMIYPYAPWVTYVNLPYLAWVMFATVLQLTITYLNW
jgi:translocator protein